MNATIRQLTYSANDSRKEHDSRKENVRLTHWVSRWRLHLAALFLLALFLRLIANAAFEGMYEGPNLAAFGEDGVEFHQIAANLVERHEYALEPGRPTSFRAPGFPFALAAVYTVFGVSNFLAARIFLSLTGALLIIAVFFLAREAADDLTALVAAALVTVYPNLLYYNIHFATEPLYTLLICASVWALLRAIKRHSLKLYSMSGLLLGLGALTRPAALLLLPLFVVAALWFTRQRFKQTIIGATLFAMMAVLTIIPWAARNYMVHHRYSLISTNSGSTFWGSNNSIVLNDPAHRGEWVSTNVMEEQKEIVRGLPNEVDRDHLEWKYGKHFLAENLRAIPRLMAYKLYALWKPVPTSPNKKLNLLIGLSYGSLLLWMVAGSWIMLRQRRLVGAQLTILSLPIAATVINALIFHGSARFRSVIEPFLLIFAAVAITAFLSKINGKAEPLTFFNGIARGER